MEESMFCISMRLTAVSSCDCYSRQSILPDSGKRIKPSYDTNAPLPPHRNYMLPSYHPQN